MAIKNTLVDLHNILFEQLERLTDDEIMDDPVEAGKEIMKAGAIKEIARVMVTNASVVLKAQRFKADTGDKPDAILIGQKDDE